MKKYLSLLLCLALLFTLAAGCASSAQTDSASAASSASVPEVSSAESEAEPEDAASSESAELSVSEAEVSEAEASAESAASEEAAPVEYDTIAEKYAAMAAENNANYAELEQDLNPISYPIGDGSTTFTMWRVFSAFIWNGLMESYADMPTLPIVEDKTGINVEFVETSDGAAWEQFNLMIASGDYTDMMSMDYYATGVTGAFEEDVIIDLTDMVEENMPNYWVLLDTLDDYTLKSVYTEDGKILKINTLSSNSVSEQGLSYRADWAEEFGMDQIVTVDDMFDYLMKAKETYNCTYPIFIDNSGVLEGFTGAFGTPGMSLSYTDLAMMMDGDTVVSSLTDDGFRSYMEGFNRFYSNGLIKDNFYNETYGPDYINGYVVDDMCAVTTIRGDKFPTMTAAAASPTFDFRATTPLVLNEGESYDFLMKTSHIGNGNMSISSACEDPELLLQFMNWFYTWDGYMVTNYGEEGVCFEYDESGNPVYTDFIVNNPDGYNSMNLRNMYTNPVFNNYQNSVAIFYTYDEMELTAFDVWNNNGTSDRSMPTLNLTADESSEYAEYASTIYTYATEQALKWMIGEEALDDASWDAFVSQIKDMGIDRCVEIYQDVYNRMYL